MNHTQPKTITELLAEPEQLDSSQLSGLQRMGRTIPPVTSWQPTHHFDMDLTIKANGEWWHEGTKITKQKLVDLFASILYCEIDNHSQEKQYFLQSPAEKARITVEDVPLEVISVVQFHENGQDWLQFTTRTGDVINANATQPVYMNEFTDTQGKTQTRAYIPVRDNLHAFINRNTFYHLADIGLLEETAQGVTLTLRSGGAVFVLDATI